MSSAEHGDLVPSTSGDDALDFLSAASSLVPWLGGPLAVVFSSWSLDRKMRRAGEVVEGVAQDLRDFKSAASEQYVQTEQFQDLLEAALKRASEEPDEARRTVYRTFIVNAIRSPHGAYDDHARVLRELAELQPDHLRLLDALVVDPEPAEGGIGSPGRTLARRLGLPRERVDELAADLNTRRLTKLLSLHTTMTARGAEDLRDAITPFGKLVLAAVSRS